MPTSRRNSANCFSSSNAGFVAAFRPITRLQLYRGEQRHHRPEVLPSLRVELRERILDGVSVRVELRCLPLLE